MTETIFWHDYETTGADATWDRPVQFAGIRTDLNLEEIDQPVEYFCKLNADCVPHPEAALITRITPQIAADKGTNEAQFCKSILQHMGRAETCSVGYNSIRFDDEVTRHMLYRNFHDPYGREWKDGNSRWDLIDVVRLVAALRPSGLEWPVRDDGQTSFRLDQLTASNGIEHSGAHDAVSDVRATIALARLIKHQQPDLYDYCWKLRRKSFVAAQIDVANHKPFLYISSKIPASRHCAGLMAPLVVHPKNPDGVIAFDLSCDPHLLLQHSGEELYEILYKKADSDDQPRSNHQRINLGIQTIQINKSPIVVTSKVLTPELDQRLQIDREQAEENCKFIVSRPELIAKVRQLFDRDYVPETPVTDPELLLYEGFLSNRDRETADRIVQSSPEELANHSWSFENRKMDELLFRYRARNWPETLSKKESSQWTEFVRERVSRPWRKGAISIDKAILRCSQLREERAGDPPSIAILDDLESWLRRFHESN